MKRALTVIAVAGSMLMLGSACKKKCNIAEEDTNSGAIVENVVIYPGAGYLTSNYQGTLHIKDGHVYEDEFEVSINGGAKVPYSSIKGQYDILGYQKATECDVAFAREVIVDDINGTVTYSIKVDECSEGCDQVRVTENYVLVPKIPNGYFVYFN